MNWTQLISDLSGRGWTLERIAQVANFASKGHVHQLLRGKTREPLWSRGDALIKLHRKVMRRKIG